MTESEYKRQLRELDARFDGEIRHAEQVLESATAAHRAERAKYEKWYKQAQAAGQFNPANPFFDWQAARATIEAARRPMEIAQAAAAQATDALAARKANKASRVRKIKDAYAASFLAQAEAAARAELAQVLG